MRTSRIRCNAQNLTKEKTLNKLYDDDINAVLKSLHIDISDIGGWCPVQAEGTVFGTPFYFRARHESYFFGVGNDPVGLCINNFADGWFIDQDWGDGEEDAGYMPIVEAKRLIVVHSMEYIKDKRLICATWMSHDEFDALYDRYNKT